MEPEGASLEQEGQGQDRDQPDSPVPEAGLEKEVREPILSQEKSGDRIGYYRLLQEIGHGGCGVVYMAEQERPMRRRVALKVIKLGMDTRQVVARFEAERQAMALMDHPNIAKALDAGATATGRPYFVMELVGGIKITDYCNQNNLSTRQRVELFIQVCRAIQHAHQKGIIHRDIKPANVLIAMQDGVPVPKVIDFGIAKATQGRLTDETLFTAFEQFLGTPAYMSPEQTQLGSLDVDTRSDIYSLGVLLYELLTGKTPFDTREMLAAGLDEMRRTIREKEPPRPSTRLTQELAAADAGRSKSPDAGISIHPEEIEGASPSRLHTRELAGLVRGDLDWIVMKCLEKDRARRYETANGLALDLERHLNHEPVMARPPSWTYTLNKFFRRNKLFVSAGALVALVLLMGVLGSTWQAVRATRAEQAQRHLREEAQAARQDAAEKLWAARLAEARAMRMGGQSGQNFESLRAIREAAMIRPSMELRNEAIASMVLPDIRPAGRKTSSQNGSQVNTGGNLEYYAATDSSGMVRIRRMSDDAELATLPAIGKPPFTFGLFSPDGKLVVVIDADHRLRVWDWSKPAMLLECYMNTSSYAFTEDGRNFAFTDGTNCITHNLISGVNVTTIPAERHLPGSMLGLLPFDPSGRLLTICRVTETNDEDDIITLDANSGRELVTLPHDDYVPSIAWHPDGRHLATVCTSGELYLWDTATGMRLAAVPSEQAVSLRFNHQGNLLIASGWDGKTRLLDFPTCRQRAGIYRSGYIVGISPDDKTLATRSWDAKTLELFDVVSGTGLQTIHQSLHPTTQPGGAAFFSPSGKLLAYPTLEGVSVWDVSQRRIAWTATGEDLFPIGFDPREESLLLEGPNGIQRCAFKNHFPGEITNPESSIRVPASIGGAVVSPDGRICAATVDNGWRIVRTDSFTELARIVSPRDAFGLTLSPNGTLLAIGARYHPGVKVWNTRTGTLVRELPVDAGHGEPGASVKFSADGRYLVAATVNEFCFWNADSWALERRILQQPENDFPAAMVFSPDGKIFAGTHSRNIVRLYDATGTNVLADLEAPNSKFITSLSFNDDGTLLAACESRDTVNIWDLRTIREQLAAMNLDWDMPPYPPKAGTSPSASLNASAPAPSSAR